MRRSPDQKPGNIRDMTQNLKCRRTTCLRGQGTDEERESVVGVFCASREGVGTATAVLLVVAASCKAFTGRSSTSTGLSTGWRMRVTRLSQAQVLALINLLSGPKSRGC